MELNLIAYTQAVRSGISHMMQLALLMLCLALWLHRKRPTKIISNTYADSVRFNLAVATLDILVLTIPLGLVGFWSREFVHDLNLVLFRQEFVGPLAQAATAALVLVVGDLVGYWRHRIEHLGWFWRSHLMHHSDQNMNWTTTFRIHPINRFATTLIDGCVLTCLGFPIWAVFFNFVVRHYYGVFVHINQPWTLGWASWAFVSPAMHRWHHVLEGQGVGKNFASMFSIFDRAFGTYFCPGPCREPVGVHGFGDSGIVQQYLLPFDRRRLR